MPTVDQAAWTSPSSPTWFPSVWPLLDAEDLVGDLWTVPAFLRACAPWLDRDDVLALQRDDPHAWTDADLPFLDAARRRLGDRHAARNRRRHAAAVAADRARRADVVTDLIAADDSEMLLMSMLRGDDLQAALDTATPQPDAGTDRLAGRFAHVVVDEAQELTDAQWHMLLARCPSRSFTVVGDRAQARHGFTGSWQQRLARLGLDRVTVTTLGINYRTPVEVMAEAEPVIRAAVPDADVPVSVRATGRQVLHGHVDDLDRTLSHWLAGHPDGIACVIGAPAFPATPRVRSLSPDLVKGLEFDLVVLVDPDAFGTGLQATVDRYVTMTRATGQLAVLTP